MGKELFFKIQLITAICRNEIWHNIELKHPPPLLPANGKIQ
jgi:hypothetical protein